MLMLAFDTDSDADLDRVLRLAQECPALKPCRAGKLTAWRERNSGAITVVFDPERLRFHEMEREVRRWPGLTRSRRSSGRSRLARSSPRRRPADELEAAIEELNAKYFVLANQGQTVVAEEMRDEVLDRNRLVFWRAADLVLFYKNRKVVVGRKPDGSPILKDLGSVWLDHPERRTYSRMALIPRGECPPDTYNLWRGFGVEPKPGEWPLIHRHLLEVICDGDQAAYDWLIRWCAHCVQHPAERAEVAVVLRGEKGTGKGVFAEKIMLSIFRDHGLQVANPRQFTGQFNAHLQGVLFLFVDEAFWAGDKASEGVLKSLVTERTLMIEPKHVNAFAVPNQLKILMASNNDWVVPATADERRFFALNVSSCHKDDRAYFEPLVEAIKSGELASFLYDLLALDLAGFDHRNPPHTRALDEQKLLTNDSFESFWIDCLYRGRHRGTGGGRERSLAKGDRVPRTSRRLREAAHDRLIRLYGAQGRRGLAEAGARRRAGRLRLPKHGAHRRRPARARPVRRRFTERAWIEYHSGRASRMDPSPAGHGA